MHNPTLRELTIEDNKKILTSNSKEAQKQFGKETMILWKHLNNEEGSYSFNDAVRDIFQLRKLHKQMDEAVLEAYGWHEDSNYGPPINLAHDFYEIDYLPENDRIRFTISPEARKEILKRLLLLNHEIHEGEVKGNLKKGKNSKNNKSRKKANDPNQLNVFQ